MKLRLEPLAGELAPDDRQIAWRLYVALVTRSRLRDEQMPETELRDLIDALRTILQE